MTVPSLLAIVPSLLAIDPSLLAHCTLAHHATYWATVGCSNFICVIHLTPTSIAICHWWHTVLILIGRNRENCDVVHVGLTKSDTIITTLGNKCLLWTESAGDKKFKFSMAQIQHGLSSQIPSWTYISEHCWKRVSGFRLTFVYNQHPNGVLIKHCYTGDLVMTSPLGCALKGAVK